MSTFVLAIALLLAPVVSFEKFYASIRAEGLTFTDEMKSLDGKRVRLRGYAVDHPRIENGLFLTRFEHEDPHGVEEHDLPFDSVAVIWKKDIVLPPIPRRPTVEGVLRLGNRTFGESQVVTITLEDATPVVPEADAKK
ncbi:MAG TPA: hypothetical protein VGQ76_00645 [Thermoanaerobaculia bacterium]|jgi:hypothetical protein|nr:hypothetical protein [Thermoanaerobaculia bacterium]